MKAFLVSVQLLKLGSQYDNSPLFRIISYRIKRSQILIERFQTVAYDYYTIII